jgi:peroxiredoxin
MKRILFLFAIALVCSQFTFADDGSVDALRAEARRAKPEEAIKLLKKAIKADHSCIACWAEIAEPYRKLGAFKDAESAGQKIVELAMNDVERARGHVEIGWSYVVDGDASKKPSKYADAERELREALRLQDNAVVHFFLGRALLSESKDTEGIDELKKAVAMDVRPDYKKQAERFIENPRRAREPFIPDFSLTTLDGHYLSNDELAGKIVVLDFWGAWCPPCVASVGEMRRLASHFKDNPDVVILSISTDSDEGKLRDFIASHKMEWVQAWDQHHKVTAAFGVNSFPTYLVVDREGIMKRVEHGGGGNQIGMVEEQVKNLLKDSKLRVASSQ